jgi:hypothetical protein
MFKTDPRDLIVTALGVVLAYFIINAAIAGAMLEAGQPAASARWWPGLADAGVAIAQKRLDAGDTPGALRAADWAIGREPLNVGALREAGLAMEKRGDIAKAEPLMRFAGERSWRDAPTTAWLLKRDLLEHHDSAAVDDIDAMLRQNTDPKLQARMMSLLAVATTFPPLRPPIVRQLTLNPPWRSDFLRALGGWPQDHGGADAVLSALKNTRSPPTAGEMAAYIDRLLDESRYADALDAWRRLSPTAAMGASALVHNGDFRADPDGTPLDWWIAATTGATASIDKSAANAGGGRGLRIEYDGVSQSSMPAQLLVLPPGAYRISGTATTEFAASGTGLRWGVICKKPPSLLGKSPLLGATTGRFDFAFDVQIPADCPAQLLALAPEPGERSTDLVIWFSNIRAEPTKAPKPAAGANANAASVPAADATPQ